MLILTLRDRSSASCRLSLRVAVAELGVALFAPFPGYGDDGIGQCRRTIRRQLGAGFTAIGEVHPRVSQMHKDQGRLKLASTLIRQEAV